MFMRCRMIENIMRRQEITYNKLSMASQTHSTGHS